ncbi:hypothetical protein [Neisseria iguanae]|uniref:Uncharacterized protein n=1 Tax=Neisseria iguanae TaxID=90242 RepID=A0A2P7TX87_9NEIS|nr:hypothetical protein [Neisseria iguanae]PSJ79342.1 hypothetical protein C7N83_12795 [Neisseria iguanae]
MGEALDRHSLVQILPLHVDWRVRQLADGIEINNRDYCDWRQNHLDDDVSTTPLPQDLLRNTF